jgi:hypothetical protein
MKYINKTNAAGIHLTEASPIDDRSYIKTEAEVASLVNKEFMPSVMYDGMIVQFADTRRSFIWVEAQQGLMATGYTYPDWYDDIQGQNYAGKLYNFVLYDTVCKIEIKYTNANALGILVPIRKLPYHILKDMDSACVTMKSSATSYRQVEYPDQVHATPEGLLIILDPKPALQETFKITIL